MFHIISGIIIRGGKVKNMAKITKEIAEKLLGPVAHDKAFYVHDDGHINSLLEFESVLGEMQEETFRYHSNDGKNDFSVWVREVVGDEKLSRDLQKSQSREGALKAVVSRVGFLKTRV